jgi:VanZ family protein
VQSRGKIKDWLPAIAVACMISMLSTDAFSGDHTSLYIIPVLHRIFPSAEAESLLLIHAVIRKLAHFTEYFLFGLALFRGTRGENRGWTLRWALWAVAIAAGYAALDEFHQVFVPSRHASPWDSLLDTTGAAVAQVAVWAARKDEENVNREP